MKKTTKELLKTKWEKCWKLNSSPPLEVYKTYINYFGTNIDIDEIDEWIDRSKRDLRFIEEAKAVWEKEFKTSTKTNN